MAITAMVLFMVHLPRVVAAADSSHRPGFPTNIVWISFFDDGFSKFDGTPVAIEIIWDRLNLRQGSTALIVPTAKITPYREESYPTNAIRMSKGTILSDLFSSDFLEQPVDNYPILAYDHDSKRDAVVIHLSAEGSISGETSWGLETLSPKEITSLAASASQLLDAPVVLLLEKCHAATKEQVETILNETQSLHPIYVIAPTSADEKTQAISFDSLWSKYRKNIWPRLRKDPSKEQSIESTFARIAQEVSKNNPNAQSLKEYTFSKTMLYLAVGMFGLIDADHPQGVSAVDLCNYLRDADQWLSMLPISGRSMSSKTQYMCFPKPQENGDIYLTKGKYMLRFDMADELKPIFGVMLSSEIRRIETSGDDSLDVPGTLSVCANDDCIEDIRCVIESTNGDFELTCQRSGAPKTVVRTFQAPEFAPQYLREILRDVFSRKSRPAARADGKIVPPEEADLYIVMDRSGSMANNDRDGTNRLSVIDNVVLKAVAEQMPHSIKLVAFSRTVRMRDCTVRAKSGRNRWSKRGRERQPRERARERGDAQDPTLARLRRCLLQGISARSSTDLVGAMQVVARDLTRPSHIWVISDGAQTSERRECNTSEQLETCAERLLREQRPVLEEKSLGVYVAFLTGVGGTNPEALKQLQEPTRSSDAMFVVLRQGGDPKAQAELLEASSRSMLGLYAEYQAITWTTCAKQGRVATIGGVSAEFETRTQAVQKVEFPGKEVLAGNVTVRSLDGPESYQVSIFGQTGPIELPFTLFLDRNVLRIEWAEVSVEQAKKKWKVEIYDLKLRGIDRSFSGAHCR